MSDNDDYPFHAVAEAGYNFSPLFLRYAGIARRTPKCVFTKPYRRGGWAGAIGSEYRFNLKTDKVWLFDTYKDAESFVGTVNTLCRKEHYDSAQEGAKHAQATSTMLYKSVMALLKHKPVEPDR